ncbi:YdcH family protein [Thalassococcus sp. S3]|uniref:YdcH family protein n=1 Tax=Thalassococcus sp. S3 TaxID=2017482 RepID=UPI0010241E45|nr:DUF465 domain-containing protein [Thalassococcus sp. S3]QBF32862.1 hypothetical protein CFI11_16780 [Thalassococcus sp. S3]
MSHTPHELADEFPEKVPEMQRLKAENGHFARLMDQYHRINRAVHRAETRVEPMEEFEEQELRKKRMELKDKIWGILSRV